MNPDLNAIRSHLYAAVVCDAMDQLGLHHQSPRIALPLQTRFSGATGVLAGRCKTTLWCDMAHRDPEPYAFELKAVDECRPDDVLIAAAGGSMRSGIWGELLTTAAKNQGCVGAIIDGAVRDVDKIAALQFPVFAKGRCVYDSLNRQRVVDVDVPVEIDGVRFEPGDLVVADNDGLVVVPHRMEADVLKLAFAKVLGENQVRDAIRAGMSSREAFNKYGIL
ncbi:MAG: RraA family protein [Pirellula sp.]|jgi:regulator of RNase E activity RraA